MANRGFFAVGIFHPKFELNQGTLWRSAAAFGAAFAFTVGARFTRQASDTGKSWRHVPMLEFADLDDLIEHLPYSCPLIGVELAEGAVKLGDFSHPERAAYLLGAEDHGLPRSAAKRCHRLVQIANATACLNVAVAGSIVMYDRLEKFKKLTQGNSLCGL